MKNGKICILKVVTFGIVKITCRIFNIVVTFVFKPFGTGHEFKRKLFLNLFIQTFKTIFHIIRTLFLSLV